MWCSGRGKIEREGWKPSRIPRGDTTAGSCRKHLGCKLCLSSPAAEELGFLTPTCLGHWLNVTPFSLPLKVKYQAFQLFALCRGKVGSRNLNSFLENNCRDSLEMTSHRGQWSRPRCTQKPWKRNPRWPEGSSDIVSYIHVQFLLMPFIAWNPWMPCGKEIWFSERWSRAENDENGLRDRQLTLCPPMS